jgi:hypothetical protein
MNLEVFAGRVCGVGDELTRPQSLEHDRPFRTIKSLGLTIIGGGGGGGR